MTTLEHELLEKFRQLNEREQREVIEFARTIEAVRHHKAYTRRELMALPFEERERILAASIDLAADEDFEIFEAYGEEDIDESP